MIPPRQSSIKKVSGTIRTRLLIAVVVLAVLPAAVISISSIWIGLNTGREQVLEQYESVAALKEADIGYRIITGGNFLRHDVIQYFDYDRVGEIKNADIAHDRGFFVGNHPKDLRPQIERFREVLDRAAR